MLLASSWRLITIRLLLVLDGEADKVAARTSDVSNAVPGSTIGPENRLSYMPQVISSVPRLAIPRTNPQLD